MILMRHEFRVGLIVALWLGTMVAGFAIWENYETTPGGAIQATESNPHPATGRWLLVMFVHPRCECTRASLTELREILSRNSTDLDVRIVFVRPKGVAEGWERDSLWTSAAEIPGVRLERDPDGVEASREGAIISGHIVLHNPAGLVMFRGGITKSRGRVGDNPGRRTILSLLRGESTSEHNSPTFGCSLVTPRDCCEKEGVACQPR